MNKKKYSSKKITYKKITKKICPNCKQQENTTTDNIHAETYCNHCGLILEAPPQYGIIFPGLYTITIKIPEIHEE